VLEFNGLEYEIVGAGEPVLLVHGSHIADSFLPLTREASLAGHRLIRYHRRGFAGSERASASFRIEDQAQDARALLDHLGVDRAHVVGHSYGGVISLQLALAAPERVRSLTLLEPALMSVPSAQLMMEHGIGPAIERYASGDPAGAVDAFLSAVGGAQWRPELEAALPGAAEQAERDAATFFETEMPALQSWAFDVERANRIQQPVVYVIGNESGPVFEEGIPLLRSWLPQTREVRLSDVNHSLLTQDPKSVAGVIAEFLDAHAD
jgi:pimeloyl-ACP methyl ester carboxylesterase